MNIGIDKLGVYVGRLSLDIADLARARGLDQDYVAGELMCRARAVIPAFEDGVTLAVNAATRILSPSDLESIGLLIVGTESAVDFGKPISTWVHRFAGLGPNCRSFEVKHACYGGTAALKMAASWIASGVQPGKKALVISADCSRSFLGAPWEPIGGGCAVAMLVSESPGILDLDLGAAGYWTDEIADTFRPTSRDELMNDQKSLFSYHDALDGAFDHYEENVGSIDYRARFKRHIYHAPFPGMALRAHRAMLGRLDVTDRALLRADFDEKVAGGLTLAREIGSCYGASNFVCLLGLLHTAGDLVAGDRISFFAYGSGCQGEFYEGTLGPRAVEHVRALDLDGALGARAPLSVESYERIERAREAQIDRRDFTASLDGVEGAYEAAYAGRRLLVLKQVEGHERSYAWS